MGNPDPPQQRFWMCFSHGNICLNIPHQRLLRRDPTHLLLSALICSYQSEVAWPVLYIDVAKNFERQIRKMLSPSGTRSVRAK